MASVEFAANKRPPLSADPGFIPLRLGDRLTPEQLAVIFPKAKVAIQQMVNRMAATQTATVEVAS